ncbi:MAG: hypothetical protein U9N83_19290 [Thermodesulfobacteriota bacterium]|nr:hypothetical protein [Thermodesulfobacteriota bacterium]
MEEKHWTEWVEIIADIRWKLIHYLTSAHPAKKNVILSTILVINQIVSLKELIRGYKEKKMAKALIVCATRTGETIKIGELIAEGIRFSGHEANLELTKLLTGDDS